MGHHDGGSIVISKLLAQDLSRLAWRAAIVSTTVVAAGELKSPKLSGSFLHRIVASVDWEGRWWRMSHESQSDGPEVPSI